MGWRNMNHRDWGNLLSGNAETQNVPSVNGSNTNMDLTNMWGFDLGSDSTFTNANGTYHFGWALGSILVLQGLYTQTTIAGYGEFDWDFDGTTGFNDYLDAGRYQDGTSANSFADAQLKTHMNTMLDSSTWDAWKGDVPRATHGGIAHRYSDMGVAYAGGTQNIRASDVRNKYQFRGSGDYNTVLRTGDDTNPSSNYVRNGGWHKKIPEYLYVDAVQGQDANWVSKMIPKSLVNDLDGVNCRWVFLYQNGASGTSYQGDIQIGDIKYHAYGGPSGKQQINHTFANDAEGFQYASFTTTGTTTNVDGIYDFSTSALDGITWSNVGTGTTQYAWNRDSGGTPSGSTGLTTGAPNTGSNFYLYAETSGTSTNSRWYALRSPVFQFAADGSHPYYQVARYGSNIGRMHAFLKTEPVSLVTLVGDLAGGSTTTVQTKYVSYPSQVYGKKIRVVFVYMSGTSYTGDIQLSDCFYNATNSTTGGTNLNLADTAERGYWRWNGSSTQSFTTDTIEGLMEREAGWFPLGTPSGGFWGKRANGTNTPSGSTGVATVGTDTNYAYFEASSPGYSYKINIMRTQPFIAGGVNQGIRWRQGNYGSTINQLRVYFQIGDILRLDNESDNP